MAKLFHDLKVPIDENLEELIDRLVPHHGEFRVLRKSLDARRAHSPQFIYSLEVAEKNEILNSENFKLNTLNYKGPKPLIVGTGPAGLFAALRLAERGIPSIIFERGSQSHERIKSINKFWRYGVFDKRNNVCFGEGGAGLYSDGKLITRIKSLHIPYVMNRLVHFGAPEEIQWLSNPHVGSDRIRRIIPFLRNHLIQLGCEIHFDTQVTQIITNGTQITGIITEHEKTFNSSHLILATGHSAEDMIHHLHEIGVHLDGKSFAVGLRVEHPQILINKIQYREFYNHPKVGAANYKLTHHDHKTNVGVYSFCMCPGGYVLSSGTESDGLVSNGMSNYNRNSPYSNAAIVVSIDHEKLFGTELLGGLKFRRELEMKAKGLVLKSKGTKELPAQRVVDFLNGKTGPILPNSSPSGAVPVQLHSLLPTFLRDKLNEGLCEFDKKMKGFTGDQALLFGVETRTSCPIRITRDSENLQSISHKGLYPTGEGAGYAGGITSAACDGVKIADRIFQELGGNLEKSNS